MILNLSWKGKCSPIHVVNTGATASHLNLTQLTIAWRRKDMGRSRQPSGSCTHRKNFHLWPWQLPIPVPLLPQSECSCFQVPIREGEKASRTVGWGGRGGQVKGRKMTDRQTVETSFPASFLELSWGHTSEQPPSEGSCLLCPTDWGTLWYSCSFPGPFRATHVASLYANCLRQR